MPTYRVYIDGIDTGDTIDASDYVNAYFDVSSNSRALPFRNEVRLVEVELPEDHL